MKRTPFFHDLSPENWSQHQDAHKKLIKPYMGDPSDSLPLDFRTESYEVVEESQLDGLNLQKVRYMAEPDEPVHAWVLRKPDLAEPAPAILCLHGTNPYGKDCLIKEHPKYPGRNIAPYLARAGFIVFAPDHLAAGERQTPDLRPYDTAEFYKRHPDWSEIGKLIWDTSRALDVMSQLPGIDINRTGVIGHSLGGYGAFISLAFEPRLKAAVSSCGLVGWEGLDKKYQLNWARDSWYRHFPKLRDIFINEEPLPFELYEIAALCAPRPFMNISGMGDPMYGSTKELPEIGRQLWELYSSLGSPGAFANFLFGGVHETPIYTREASIAWFQRWLQDTQVSL